jgi:hypothetical protein
MPRIELHRFRYFDPLRKRWMVAGYRATRETIAARYERWAVLGEPEIRESLPEPMNLTAGHVATSDPARTRSSTG